MLHTDKHDKNAIGMQWAGQYFCLFYPQAHRNEWKADVTGLKNGQKRSRFPFEMVNGLNVI